MTTTRLATAISLALGANLAQAATYSATLVQFASYSNSGSSAANITSSTATWTFDDVTGQVTQTGGTFNARFTIGPSTTLFRLTSTGLVAGGGGAASATTWSCIEGNFGAGVGASICGNYNFGANFANQSTLTYSGNTVSRTLGGDDAALGPAQSVAGLDGMSAVSWIGTTLIISNGACGGSSPPGCTEPMFNAGYKMVLQAVPLPAAAWLFGGALGALGLVRRRSGS